MAQVSVNLPNYGEDEVEVLYLGRFPNGETSEVTDDQVATWERETGREWPEGGTLEVPQGSVQELAEVPGDAEFPYHVGGGMYVLSDGSKVRGQEAAQKAEDELDGDNAGGE